LLNIARKRRPADAGPTRVSKIELPLDSPEQIALSVELDGALERRTRRRKAETELEAAEIANDRERFRLLSEKIFLGAGLLLFLFVAVAIVLLALSGAEKAALLSVVTTGGLGATNFFFRQRKLRQDGERD
jgi:hypothetical protein